MRVRWYGLRCSVPAARPPHPSLLRSPGWASVSLRSNYGRNGAFLVPLLCGAERDLAPRHPDKREPPAPVAQGWDPALLPWNSQGPCRADGAFGFPFVSAPAGHMPKLQSSSSSSSSSSPTA